jgi:hypothetical protein
MPFSNLLTGYFIYMASAKHLMIVVTQQLGDHEPLLDELRQTCPNGETRVVVISPAVEDTVFQHALGDQDTARRSARRRLEACLEELRDQGISALGEVGGNDPVAAAADALRRYPADEVLLVTHPAGRDRWYEEGLFDRASQLLHAPVRLVRPS